MDTGALSYLTNLVNCGSTGAAIGFYSTLQSASRGSSLRLWGGEDLGLGPADTSSNLGAAANELSNLQFNKLNSPLFFSDLFLTSNKSGLASINQTYWYPFTTRASSLGLLTEFGAFAVDTTLIASNSLSLGTNTNPLTLLNRLDVVDQFLNSVELTDESDDMDAYTKIGLSLHVCAASPFPRVQVLPLELVQGTPLNTPILTQLNVLNNFARLTSS